MACQHIQAVWVILHVLDVYLHDSLELPKTWMNQYSSQTNNMSQDVSINKTRSILIG